MKKMPLVSIVVPVYNVEAYLSDCLESLLKQTYQNVEIIVVDDGSTDNSLKTAEAYAAKDARIKLITQENRGQSAARNAGVKLATGEYLLYIDSDDWISFDFVDDLVLTALKTKTDMVVGGKIVYVSDGQIVREIPLCQCKNAKIVKTAAADLMNLSQIACAKLYKTSFIKKIGLCFPEGLLHEDEYYSHVVWANLKKFAVCRKGAYFYRMRSGSTMRRMNTNPKNAASSLAVLQKICDYWKEKNLLGKYDLPLYLLTRCCDNEVVGREYFDKAKNFLRENGYDSENTGIYADVRELCLSKNYEEYCRRRDSLPSRILKRKKRFHFKFGRKMQLTLFGRTLLGKR